MEEPSIWVSQHLDCAYVQVKGKGTFHNAHYAKQFAESVIKKGVHAFVFDLKDCTYIDSTFMGMMAGVACSLKPLGSTSIINPSPKNFELLQNLGLDRVMTIKSEPTQLTTNHFSAVGKESQPPDKTAVAKTMLESHETLVNVDERNAPKFQDVLTFLREKLGDSDKDP